MRSQSCDLVGYGGWLVGAAREAEQRDRKHDRRALDRQIDAEGDPDHRNGDLVQRVHEPVDQQEVAQPYAKQRQQKLLRPRPEWRVVRIDEGLRQIVVEQLVQHRNLLAAKAWPVRRVLRRSEKVRRTPRCRSLPMQEPWQKSVRLPG